MGNSPPRLIIDAMTSPSTIPGAPRRRSSVPKRVAQAVIAGVLALGLVLATTGASGEHPGEQVTSVLAGQPVRLNLPPTDEPKGVAVFFHGQGGNVNDKMDGPWLDALRRDGWVVASSLFHREAWGNPASTEDTERLIAWAEEQGGAEVKLFIGTSMGATTSLNAVVHGIESPPCWYGVKAAVDMRTMGNVPGADGFIRAAYDGEPWPFVRNPVDNASRFPADVRYRFVASPVDPYVPFEDNTEVMAGRLREAGAEVTVRPVQGPHDDPSHYSAFDLVRFANSCA